MRNLLFVAILCFITCNAIHASNVLLKINDPEKIFNECSLQRTFCGNILDVQVNRTDPLILATGTVIELQVDSFLVGFLINPDKHWFNQPVFITAGDTITFTAKKIKTEEGYIFYKLVASGKNEENYNFLANTHDNYEKYIPEGERGFEEYKGVYQEKKKSKLSLLEEMKQSLSIPFYNYALAEIENKYAWKIYNKIDASTFKIADANIIKNPLSFYYYTASWEKYCYDFPLTERFKDSALDYLVNNFSGKVLEYLLTEYVGSCVKNGNKLSLRVNSIVEEYVQDTYYLACIKYFTNYKQIDS